VTNWIPPDETCPPHAATGPKKKLSKELQHAKEILASTAFSNSTAAQQNLLVADLVAAKTAREGAVTGSTHESQAQSWQQFSKYLDSIGLGHDVFLESFTRSQRNKIIGAFAMALRQGQYSGKAYDTLDLGKIQNTI
jgi:hypothetical protein